MRRAGSPDRRESRPEQRRQSGQASGQVATVEITGIAADGAGVGRLPDGRAVFVHRVAPGDAARVKVVEERKRWARGRLIGLERGSAQRRAAPCPHYSRCGGCTIEHLTYDAQLDAKARRVADAFARIAGIEIPPPTVSPSPAEFGYRNRLSFSLRRLGSGRVVAGFHAIDDPGRIVDIDERCLLPEPALASAWGQLRANWGPGAYRLPAGERLRLTLRATAFGRVTLLVEGGT
ncbi:MAG TPA: TRAM domain-containing protein, partial [Longimicrobiales bacterium]|nr:TRAM domain-containing protein [Longimicrobiales bacterium]